MIRRLFSLALTLAVILAVVGYVRGWYVVTRGDSNGEHLNFGISVDKDKIKADAEKVENMTREATKDAKEKFDSASQAVKDSRR